MGSGFWRQVESVCFSHSLFIIQVLFERWQSQAAGQDEELEALIYSNTVSRFIMVDVLRSNLELAAYLFSCYFCFFSNSCTEINSKQEYPTHFLWAIHGFCHILLCNFFSGKENECILSFLMQNQFDNFTHSCHPVFQPVLATVFRSLCQQKTYLMDKMNV